MKWQVFLVLTLLLSLSQQDILAQSIEEVREKGISYHERLKRSREQDKLETDFITTYEALPHGAIRKITKERLSDSNLERYSVEIEIYDSLNQLLYDSSIGSMTRRTYGKDSMGSYVIDTFLRISLSHWAGRQRMHGREWDTTITVSRARSFHGLHHTIHDVDSVWEYLDTSRRVLQRLTINHNVLREKYFEQRDIFGRSIYEELTAYDIGEEKFKYIRILDYSIPHHQVSTRISITYPLDTLATSRIDFDSTSLCTVSTQWSVYSGRSESVECQDSDGESLSNTTGGRHLTFERSQNASQTESTHRTYENGVLILERVERYRYELWKK